MHLLAAVLLALALPSAASAHSGALDRSFGSHGIVVGPPGPAATLVRTLPGHRTVALWEQSTLASFSAGGQRIGAFPELQAALATPAERGIAVLTMNDDTDRRVTVERFGPDGEGDSAFGVAGVASVPSASSDRWSPEVLLVDARARPVVIGGWSNKADETVVVARLTVAGAVDPEFGQRGSVSLGPNRSNPLAAARRDGGLTIAVTTARGNTRLIGLSPAGAVDASRRVLGRPVEAMVRLADGHLLAVNGRSRAQLVKLRSDGRRDRAFPRLRFPGKITALATDRRNRLLVATAEMSGRADLRSAVVRRFSREGVSDQHFGRAVVRVPRQGWRATTATSLLADGSDRVLVGGVVYDGTLGTPEPYGTPHPLLARLRG
jgi:hypothetical protein